MCFPEKAKVPDVQAVQAARAVRADVQAVCTAQAQIKDKSKKHNSKAEEDENLLRLFACRNPCGKHPGMIK